MNNQAASKTIDLKAKNNLEERFSFLRSAEKLLGGLNERSKDIIQKRFGLSQSKKETLESIGRQYNITRERVRQIISEALKNIVAKIKEKDFVAAEEKIIFTIEKNNGIIKQEDLAKKFGLNDLDEEEIRKEINAIHFFARCSVKILEVENRGIFEKAWVISEEIKQEVVEILKKAEEIVQGMERVLTDEEILSELEAAVPHISRDKTAGLLEVSTRVKKNNFGKWGMAHWMDIRPKGTRERAHLILKEHKKPLHFTEIAELIDKFKLSKRKAHPQTVHNELIKNEKFILIGRGIYALKDWGYDKGTIKDVIEDILRQSGRVMKKEEIIREVLKRREVKETTIMINLNNQKYFSKKGEFYSLKK